MTDDDPPRSATARAAAELALVRVVHHYAERPEFVLLGGLVPALLCAGSPRRHAGTTDVDVQVNLEIAGGSVHAARLEEALRNAEFEPDDERVWRWTMSDPTGSRATVKFELLADLDTEPDGVTVRFSDCDHLGAANLRGTGYAVLDRQIHHLIANDHGVRRHADINITGLAGFLLAKAAAARGRRKPKDWYDIAFVLLHHDHGDAAAAARRVREIFGPPAGSMLTYLHDLRANFDGPTAQGTTAYVEQLTLDHPELDPPTVAADGQLAVQFFCDGLIEAGAS
jgi:hypothetical protein